MKEKGLRLRKAFDKIYCQLAAAVVKRNSAAQLGRVVNVVGRLHNGQGRTGKYEDYTVKSGVLHDGLGCLR